MEQQLKEQVYDAACRTMGEAVWHLVSAGQQVTQDAIADMIVVLSERRGDLADSIALTVLNGT